MSEATSSKTPTKKAATKKTTKSTVKRAGTTKSRSTTARKSTASKRTTSTSRTTTTKKAAPAKKAAAKKTTTKKAETAAKTTAPKKTTAKAASPKAAKTAAKTTRKSPPKAATSSSSTQRKKSEKKSVKSAAKVPAAKAKPETAAESGAAADGDKPKIAPAPMRPALRVAKRAEARRDKNQTFKVNTQIIYPAHGVGHIADVEKQSIADIEVELFVIDFEHEKMKLRVPVVKAAASGMRNLSTPEQIDEALELLEGKARVKRTMWSRRAQEYEAKINSGDLISVAEVVRDLFRADDQPEQSYSERQLFEQARERFGREVAAVRKKSLEKAIEEIHVHLDRKEKVEGK